MPNDQDIGLEDIATAADGFLKRIPEEIRDTFTEQQIAGINQAFRRSKHNVDIRVTLPLPWGRRYFVLLSGNERRSPERQRSERRIHPLSTRANLVVIAIFFGISLYLFVSMMRIFIQAMQSI